MDFEPLEEYKLKLKDLSAEKNKPFKEICCPSCEAVVSVEDLNIHDKIGKCKPCNIVFPFDSEIKSLLQPAVVTTKQELLRPEGIDLFYYKDELDISIKQPYAPLDIFGALLGLMFGFMFIGIAAKKQVTFLFVLAALMFVWMFYSIFKLIRHKKAKIYINMDGRYLNIQYRPKNFHADKRYRVDEIDQVYVTGGAGHCIVNMIVNAPEGQKHVQLIPGLTNLSKARFLEQEIERHLGIPDRMVPEETK